MMELRQCVKFLLTIVVVFGVSVTCLDFKYHTHEELTNYLKNYTKSHKNFFSRLYSVGRSINGKDLWVLEVAAAKESKLGTPNVKLIGNIHGNEPAGREVLLHFLEYLAEEYTNNNATIQWLLENTRIHVMPSMNPDGFEISSMGICTGDHGRTNAKLIDLNRNFPDYYKPSVIPPQPESLAIQKWMQQVPFVLSAGLHGGALVANYPFDTVKEQKWEKLLKDLSNVTTQEEELKLRQEYIESLSKTSTSLTPDDDVFIHLAKTYANNHPTMHHGYPCPDSNRSFTNGITNGAEWYPIRGGMQDFNYFRHGCMELTLEISCCKYPFLKKLPKIWLENNGALIHFLIQANRGVAGQVLDYETNKPVPFASLKIVGRDMNFTSTKNGEFWRILLPGIYRLEVQAWGYHGKRTSFTVLEHENELPSHRFIFVHLRSLISRPKEPSAATSPSTVPDESSRISQTEIKFSTSSLELTTQKIPTTIPIVKEYSSTEKTSEKNLVQKEALNKGQEPTKSTSLFIAILFINIYLLYL